LGEFTAAVWSLILLGYWAWMALMLFQAARPASVLLLIAVSAIGFGIRRGCGSNGFSSS